MQMNRRWTQRLIHTAVVISLLIGRANWAHAGIDQWTSNGPTQAGGIITALAVDPQTPSTLYAATQDSGVFKSTDTGNSWSPANSGLPTDSFVLALAIDPQTPTTLYAVSNRSIFRSTNGGSSWDLLFTFSVTIWDQPGSGGSVKNLAIDPQTPTTLYVGRWISAGAGSGVCIGSVYKSTDGGLTWSQTALAGCTAGLAIDPQTPTTLYVGSRHHGVNISSLYKSTDGGTTAVSIMNGIFSGSGTIPDLAIDPVTPTTVYAATDVGVYKTTDGGANWRYLETSRPFGGVAALAIDPLTPTILYAGIGNAGGCYGVFKSINGGESWVELNAGLTNRCVSTLRIDPHLPDLLYAGTGAGVFGLEQEQTAVLAVLSPTSRAVQVGSAAAAYALILNTGTVTARDCNIAPVTSLPAAFLVQPLSCSTFLPVGDPNTPVAIPAGGAGCFLFAFIPTSPIAPTDVVLNFDCTNTDPAPVTLGINTFLFSAASTPIPDIIATATTCPADDGVVALNIPNGSRGPGSGTGSLVVSTLNLGVSGSVTVRADTGSANLPLTFTLCQSNPGTGACITPRTPGASATVTIGAGQAATFTVIAKGQGTTIPYNPETKRVFVRFRDNKNVVRGAASLAVRTHSPACAP